ncbi:MAG: winged helix-turn-helix transcriptional regulator [Alphaproteobacteria bacterium]|nr:winged helix-turn-helix transcriptional regulator [Alphaproteobacteria bacterium]
MTALPQAWVDGAPGLVLVTEPSVGPWLDDAGLAWTADREPDADTLARATLVVLGADWPRLRAWRAAGHRFSALVLLDGHPPPEERVQLEPLAVVQRPTPALVTAAVETLTAGTVPATLQLVRGTLDLARRALQGDAGEVRLTQREADLLAYLAARPHRDVPRDELAVQVWGHARPSTQTRAIDMAVLRLRRKIEVDPSEPEHLVATRGGGYRLVPRTVDARADLPEDGVRLGPAARRACDRLAALPAPFDLDAAATVLGVDRLDAADRLDELLDAGVVTREAAGFVVRATGAR